MKNSRRYTTDRELELNNLDFVFRKYIQLSTKTDKSRPKTSRKPARNAFKKASSLPLFQ